MIALLQRVTHASVSIDSNSKIAQINQGLLVLVAFKAKDTEESLNKMLNRIQKYRIFEDRQGKMNLSVSDVGGQLLIVPQFTLAADTKKGLRPGFSLAASPAVGEKCFDKMVQLCQKLAPETQFGQFGADMKVSLCNDGPATFWLEN